MRVSINVRPRKRHGPACHAAIPRKVTSCPEPPHEVDEESGKRSRSRGLAARLRADPAHKQGWWAGSARDCDIRVRHIEKRHSDSHPNPSPVGPNPATDFRAPPTRDLASAVPTPLRTRAGEPGADPPPHTSKLNLGSCEQHAKPQVASPSTAKGGTAMNSDTGVHLCPAGSETDAVPGRWPGSGAFGAPQRSTILATRAPLRHQRIPTIAPGNAEANGSGGSASHPDSRRADDHSGPTQGTARPTDRPPDRPTARPSARRPAANSSNSHLWLRCVAQYAFKDDSRSASPSASVVQVGHRLIDIQTKFVVSGPSLVDIDQVQAVFNNIRAKHH